jgi:hypothetical protein
MMELKRDQVKDMLQSGAFVLLREMPASGITDEVIHKAISTVATGIKDIYTVNVFGCLPDALEAEVFNHLSQRLNNIDYVVIVESEVKRESGSFPFKMILAKRAKSPDPMLPYVTWVSYERDKGVWANSYGHYDLTFTAACADFEDRCRQLGIPLGETWGRPMKAILADAGAF